jgi:hypothetical protein
VTVGPRCLDGKHERERAAQVDIIIIRTLVRVREFIAANKNLTERVGKLEGAPVRFHQGSFVNDQPK